MKDIKDQFETIQNATGVTPNALAIGDNVLRSISNTDIWKARAADRKSYLAPPQRTHHKLEDVSSETPDVTIK